jgi:2-keto-3-deoxy-L-rhamnonate aldolase RhmA
MTFELPNNKLKARLQADLMSFGIYVGIPSPTVVELAALAGLDFVRLDWAHAPLDLPLIENMVRSAEIHGITPIARLEYDNQKITSILEMGMMGIIVPGITTAEGAREVVAAAKFAPIGQRGMFSASRRLGYGAIDAKIFREWTNREIMVGIQIEDPEALNDLDRILDAPGIDLVLSGRGDLANALGIPGQRNHPEVLSIEERIFAGARARGIPVSPLLDPASKDFDAELKAARRAGARIVSLGVDLIHVKRAFEQIAATARRSSERQPTSARKAKI